MKSKFQSLIDERKSKSQNDSFEVLANKIKLLKGDKGDPGEDGITGKNGKDGAKGEKGDRGDQGPKGNDGKNGKDGKDGRDGKDGKNGKDGRHGTDAILPNLYKLAIDTINVIEHLQGDQRIDYKAIKGLDKFVRRLISEETIGLNRGFGGPGEIFHDASLSGKGFPGSLLSVVNAGNIQNLINNEIVSGNNMTWVLANYPVLYSVHLYANGQRLTETVDYIISGKNITTIQNWGATTLLADYAKQ